MNTREDNKTCTGNNVVYGGNMEITAVIEIYDKSVRICFESEDQFTQRSADVVGEVVTDRKVSVLDNGRLDGGYCDIILPAEEKVELCILDEV
jgi:hypothetical protein